MGFFCCLADDRSHALRGNAAWDALRPKKRDAERHRRRYHAEHGNDRIWERWGCYIGAGWMISTQ